MHLAKSGHMKVTQGLLLSPDKVTEAYQRIRSALCEFACVPGTFLNIRRLSECLRVSPTPIREALIRLTQDEIIGFAAGRGYYVKALDLDDLTADYEMTFVLHHHSVSQANNCAPVLPGLAIADGDGTADSRALEVEALNEMIARQSGNVRILRTIRQFNERTHSVRRARLIMRQDCGDILCLYEQLIDSLSRRRIDRAIDELEALRRLKLDKLADLIRDLNLKAYRAQTAFEDLLIG